MLSNYSHNLSTFSLYLQTNGLHTVGSFHELFTLIFKCFVCIMSGRAAHERAFSLSRGGGWRGGGERYQNQTKSQYTHINTQLKALLQTQSQFT